MDRDRRFNSARGLHPWRRRLVSTGQPTSSRFNSARGLHPWRRHIPQTLGRHIHRLQFGQGFAPLETRIPVLGCSPLPKGLQFGQGFAPLETMVSKRPNAHFLTASIRPGVCTPGDEPNEDHTVSVHRRFNSARGLHPWRQADPELIAEARHSLQFGQGFAPLETVYSGPLPSRRCGASIRPGVCTPGDDELPKQRNVPSWASIRPGVCTPGDPRVDRLIGLLVAASIRPGVCTPGDTDSECQG